MPVTPKVTYLRLCGVTAVSIEFTRVLISPQGRLHLFPEEVHIRCCVSVEIHTQQVSRFFIIKVV